MATRETSMKLSTVAWSRCALRLIPRGSVADACAISGHVASIGRGVWNTYRARPYDFRFAIIARPVALFHLRETDASRRARSASQSQGRRDIILFLGPQQ